MVEGFYISTSHNPKNPHRCVGTNFVKRHRRGWRFTAAEIEEVCLASLVSRYVFTMPIVNELCVPRERSGEHQ